jgi:hypothetical protein
LTREQDKRAASRPGSGREKSGTEKLLHDELAAWGADIVIPLGVIAVLVVAVLT